MPTLYFSSKWNVESRSRKSGWVKSKDFRHHTLSRNFQFRTLHNISRQIEVIKCQLSRKAQHFERGTLTSHLTDLMNDDRYNFFFHFYLSGECSGWFKDGCIKIC